MFTHSFYLTWLQISGSYDALLGFHHLLEQFTELREHLLMSI